MARATSISRAATASDRAKASRAARRATALHMMTPLLYRSAGKNFFKFVTSVPRLDVPPVEDPTVPKETESSTKHDAPVTILQKGFVAVSVPYSSALNGRSRENILETGADFFRTFQEPGSPRSAKSLVPCPGPLRYSWASEPGFQPRRSPGWWRMPS